MLGMGMEVRGREEGASVAGVLLRVKDEAASSWLQRPLSRR